MISVLLLFAINARAATTDLGSFQWKKRVLVLLSSKPQDQLLAQERVLISDERKNADERDLVVLEEIDPQGPFHKKLKVGHGFAAVLIGKDGAEKWRTESVFEPQTVFAKIDSMPMRKEDFKK